MKRTAKKIIVAATIAAVSLQSASTASACGGRGGRPSPPAVYGGYARAAANYRTTLPTTPPIYSAASTCNQPTYNQPIYGQLGQAPANQYPSAAHPVNAPQPVASVQPRPRAQVAAAQNMTAQNAAAPNNNGRQQTMTPQAATQPAATQTTGQQSAATNDAETSALAALASIANAGAAPVAATPQQTTLQQTTPVAASTPNANVSSTADHVGVFTATLPSNVTIELRLDNGNSFSWIVRNNGKISQFSGQYRIAEGRLVLVRSNDLQQMAGSMTSIQNGFTFKLDGTNTGGLDFKKA